MVDVSLVVMARSKSHDLPPEKEPGRWRQGEVVDVHTMLAGGYYMGNPVFHCINVTGCPGTFTQVRDWFNEFHYAPDVVGRDGLEPGPLQARRKRPIDFSLLTKAQWVELHDTGLVTVTWADLTGPGDLVVGVGAKMVERGEFEKPTTKDEADRVITAQDRTK